MATEETRRSRPDVGSAQPLDRNAVVLSALPYRREVFLAGGWSACDGDLRGDGKAFLDRFYSPLDWQLAEATATRCGRLGLLERPDWCAVTYWDPRYPPLLRHIFDPPPVLFFHGQLPDFAAPNLAIVGTRNPARIAVIAVRLFLERYAAAGNETLPLLVSGFARGVDATAHEAALQLGLPGLAVLGAGLAHAGPASSRRLLAVSESCGTALSLCSEFPPDRPAYPGNFPRRNRIIAGIAPETFLFQAPHRSGALITARFAMDEGRDVGIFDHELFAPGANDGGRKLIEEGASVIALSELEARIVRGGRPRANTDTARMEQLEFWREVNLGRLEPLTGDHYFRRS